MVHTMSHYCENAEKYSGQSSERDLFGIIIRPLNKSSDNCNSQIAYKPTEPWNEIRLEHKTKFAVGILNTSNKRCEATLFIENEEMGNFFIPANALIFIERPSHTNKGFTFISKNSDIAIATGTNLSSYMSGFIKVEIRPEAAGAACIPLAACSSSSASGAGLRVVSDGALPASAPLYAAACASSSTGRPVSSHSSDETDFSQQGATILSTSTNQHFRDVPSLRTNGLHVFNLRLIIGNQETNNIIHTEKGNRIDFCKYKKCHGYFQL